MTRALVFHLSNGHSTSVTFSEEGGRWRYRLPNCTVGAFPTFERAFAHARALAERQYVSRYRDDVFWGTRPS